MNDRPNDLLRIRPQIKKIQQFPTTSPDERFQNETIRPILNCKTLLLVVFSTILKNVRGVL